MVKRNLNGAKKTLIIVRRYKMETDYDVGSMKGIFFSDKFVKELMIKVKK